MDCESVVKERLTTELFGNSEEFELLEDFEEFRVDSSQCTLTFC